MASNIFSDAAATRRIMALPPYVHLDGNQLVDLKVGNKLAVPELYLYQSEQHRLLKVSRGGQPALLARCPHETGHWIQLVGQAPIRSLVLRLSQRLGYLFRK